MFNPSGSAILEQEAREIGLRFTRNRRGKKTDRGEDIKKKGWLFLALELSKKRTAAKRK